MDFTVLDVETANGDSGSICSIGAVRFQDGVMVDQFYTLCNPQQRFTNTWLHKISEQDVQTAPLLGAALSRFSDFAPADQKLVSHTSFDKLAMRKAYAGTGVLQPAWVWFDSARAVRKVWQEYRVRGYGLGKITKVLGIEFDHHNALEDARAAGLVLIQAFERWDGSLDDLWDQIG